MSCLSLGVNPLCEFPNILHALSIVLPFVTHCSMWVLKVRLGSNINPRYHHAVCGWMICIAPVSFCMWRLERGPLLNSKMSNYAGFISKGILTLLLLMVYWSWGSTADTSSVNRLQDDRSVLKTLLLYYYNGAWTIGTCHMSTQQ